jgi:hypothetical protein
MTLRVGLVAEPSLEDSSVTFLSGSTGSPVGLEELGHMTDLAQ